MTVVNKQTHTPTPNDIYIGRGSKWGNPFKIGVLTREEVIARYKIYIGAGKGTHLLNDLHELKGKNLVCYCAPLECHGDVLEKLLKEIEDTQATSPYLNKPLRTQKEVRGDKR